MILLFQNKMSDYSARSSFSQARFDLDKFLSTMQSLKGSFQGNIYWTYDPRSSDNWNKDRCQITEVGSLRCCKETGESNIIDHLQSCNVKFIERHNGILPIIQVSLNFKKVYLRVQDDSTFQELVCAFIWWSGLRKNGIFEKFTPQKPVLKDGNCATNLLVSRLYVFGPILNKIVPLDKKLDRPDFLPKSEIEEGWFPAMGVLKSDGFLDLLLQQDGTLIYSINITVLLRSEIRIPDTSLGTENYLFLKTIPNLRKGLKLVKNQRFIHTSKHVHNSSILLKFPLKIDLEDWFVALKSFAITENFSLIGADKSNNIRVANSFSLSILEGHFKEVEFDDEIPSLYVELSIWGSKWSRTPVVEQSYSPFWREIFTFHESLPVNDLKLEVKKASSNIRKPDKTVGYINLSQEDINDPKLVKETRLPVISATRKDQEIGTLCIKIASSLILVLPSSNFARMEKLLQKVDPQELCDLVQDYSDGVDVRIDNISDIFLDIFQALNRENDWFGALLKKELSAVDNSIARNTIQNKTSSHIYSTLFRGNSVLTISMEKYFHRVGHEYLDKSIGDVLRDIINKKVSCELDPARIEENDPISVQNTISRNRETLFQYVSELWNRIYITSNDLPMCIREQMQMFRKKLDLICMGDDINTTLNCVSGVLFLRFFCPVILNPKLFDLVSNHLDETSHRTLTLVCKVLLNLSNITYFGNKEPYMILMNEFIESHETELLDYIDKVTLKKLDFSPKQLKLTGHVARPNLTMNEEILKELPMNPYLIDKQLRETEICIFLASVTMRKEGNIPTVKKMRSGSDGAICDRPVIGKKLMIRGLEFEKITENNTEIFGSDLLKYLEDDTPTTDENKTLENSNLNEDIIGQLKQESILLYHKIGNLTQMLTDYEYPSEVLHNQPNYSEFLADNTYFSKEKKLIANLYGDLGDLKDLKKLFDFNTRNSSLFDSIITKGDPSYLDATDRPPIFFSTSESSSSLSRNITRLRSKKLPKIISGSSSEKNGEKSPGKLRRLFKKST